MHGLPWTHPRPRILPAILAVLLLGACNDRPAPPVIAQDPGDPGAAVAPAAPLSHTLDLPDAGATAPAPGPGSATGAR
jgi:hypothetical protein